MAPKTNNNQEPEQGSNNQAVEETRKVRRLSNRQFATLRSRMNGAKKRIATFTKQRDDLKGIIRRRYLVLDTENAESSAVRRLSRAELKEYRARLADVKLLLERANADFRREKKQYEAEAQKRHEASKEGLQKQRDFNRASEKKDELRKVTMEALTHAAGNGGRQFVQDLQTQISSGDVEGAVKTLTSFMEQNAPKLFNDVIPSGIVFDRVVEKLLNEVEGITLGGPSEAAPTIQSLEV